MEQIGYSLVDWQGNELQVWGDLPGVIHLIPNPVILPNGDHVHCVGLGPIQEWQIVPRMFEYGPSSSITFDGTQILVIQPEPVPEMISDRQFFQQLAVLGEITWEEAEAAVGPGILPSAFADVISTLSIEAQRPIRMLLIGATQFNRYHLVTAALMQILGKDDAWTDQLWRDAFKL